MRLSRKKAIELCIELWTWLAKTGGKKADWPGWEKYGHFIRHDCWFCEYGQQRNQKNKRNESICVYCPLSQQEPDNGCYGFAYNNWENATTPRTRKKYAKLFLEQIKTLK